MNETVISFRGYFGKSTGSRNMLNVGRRHKTDFSLTTSPDGSNKHAILSAVSEFLDTLNDLEIEELRTIGDIRIGN